uniref:spermidine synthase n=1 Tax=Actinotalea sp. TaxID=1872145 RepID=UPI0035693A48
PPARGGAPTALPEGPVAIDTGTAELRRDPSEPDLVTLLVNGVPSSALDLADAGRLEFEYMQQMAALTEHLPAGPVDAVHLGAAGCALPRWVDHTRPGSRQLGVDIDARLLELVRAWFALPRSPRLRLRAADARTALEGLPSASADLVIRDVFAGDSTPQALTTAEFCAEVARVLRPGGLYLANCADRPPLADARSEVATVRSVWPHTALVAEVGVLRGRRYGNLVVAAGPDPLQLDGARRTLRSLVVPSRLVEGADLADFARGASVRHDEPRGASVRHDDPGAAPLPG